MNATRAALAELVACSDEPAGRPTILERWANAWQDARMALAQEPATPADDLPQRLRDCYDGCPAEVTTAPIALLREAADQLERDEEHYQAAMRMSEKHRKNWVEACQRADAAEADAARLRGTRSMQELHNAAAARIEALEVAAEAGAKERETLAWLAKHATFDDMPHDLYSVMANAARAARKEPT